MLLLAVGKNLVSVALQLANEHLFSGYKLLEVIQSNSNIDLECQNSSALRRASRALSNSRRLHEYTVTVALTSTGVEPARP